jgi:hypothetical protein
VTEATPFEDSGTSGEPNEITHPDHALAAALPVQNGTDPVVLRVLAADDFANVLLVWQAICVATCRPFRLWLERGTQKSAQIPLPLTVPFASCQGGSDEIVTTLAAFGDLIVGVGGAS